MSSQYWMRRARAGAARLTLTREETRDLAEMLLKRDVLTLAGLSETELRRLVDAMDGFDFVVVLLNQRPRRQ